MNTATTRTPVASHLRASILEGIDEHIARLAWSEERIRVHQRDELRRLLAHAKTRSPFHGGT